MSLDRLDENCKFYKHRKIAKTPDIISAFTGRSEPATKAAAATSGSPAPTTIAIRAASFGMASPSASRVSGALFEIPTSIGVADLPYRPV
ncbi:hypothetical protein MHUMG1_07981 [Metarhizium humberi]|uniref:Uncharacterized protein n=1 Tax=Metarhizium humberi TaxID=2596975 RepID=A0A9P8M5H8_9HYPO|nr:hypothetical protein MHUMG1_07981 [Metarhizium humberi]